MTVLVDATYLEAGRRAADELGERLRERFREAYGPAGDRMVNAMVTRMQENIRSDSGVLPEAHAAESVEVLEEA